MGENRWVFVIALSLVRKNSLNNPARATRPPPLPVASGCGIALIMIERPQISATLRCGAVIGWAALPWASTTNTGRRAARR
jgi:hypothetical protein